MNPKEPLILSKRGYRTIDEYSQDYSDAVVYVNNSVLNLTGEHTFKRIHLLNGAVLTHNPADSTTYPGLVLHITDSLYIDETSRLDVSGKGYPWDPDNCALTHNFECGATGISGGSYGGIGGQLEGHSGSVYGNIMEPVDLGSSGASSSHLPGAYGGAGGGRIEINAPIVAVEGGICANGLAGINGGGGSGGSILINADTLKGNGFLQADGGIGGFSGGGSGGRISLINCDVSSIDLEKVSANGATGKAIGDPGSIYLGIYDSLITTNRISTKDTLFINNDYFVIENGSYQYEGYTIIANNSNLIIDGNHWFEKIQLQNSRAELTGKAFLSGNFNVIENSLMTHKVSTNDSIFRLEVASNDLIFIDSSSCIDLKYKGYPEFCTVNGKILYPKDGAGGCHGGKGTNKSCEIYDSFEYPYLPGSGSTYADTNNNNLIIPGGGVVFLQSSYCEINGYISAFGSAGGSVLIKTDTLSGTGSIGTVGSGGGRIAIHSPTIEGNILDNLYARGDGVGTVYIESGDKKSLIFRGPDNYLYSGVSSSFSLNPDETLDSVAKILVEDCSMIFSDTFYIDSLIIDAGQHVVHFLSKVFATHMKVLSGVVNFSSKAFISDMNVISGEITLEDTLFANNIKLHTGTVIKPSASDRYLTKSLTIIADTMVIDSGAFLNADIKGYPTGYTVNGDTCSFEYPSGGSHGGSGYGNTCPTYGEYRYPSLPGSGGTRNDINSAGGGVIKLDCGLIDLQGVISARSYYQYSDGRGAGGSILIFADTITGKGSISANGYGGGGGGRIAVYCPTISNEIKNNLFASGFGPGTIYVANDTDQTYPVLFKSDNIAGPTYIPADDTTYNDALIEVKNAHLIFEDNIHLANLILDSGKVEFQGNMEIPHIEMLSGEIIFHANTSVSNLEIFDGLVSFHENAYISNMEMFGGEVIVDNDTLFVDTLTMDSSAFLTHNPSERYLPRSLTVISHTIYVDSGAAINAMNKGFPLGYTVNGDTCSFDYHDGGSHGGNGEGNSCATYGNYQYPTLPGAGGSYSTNGGGAIILQSGLIELYGKITASSLNGSWGCGAGGSVLIIADTVHGNGSISASGGRTSYEGDGGGGRIAIHCPQVSIDILNNLEASGYSAGTIYLATGNTPNPVVTFSGSPNNPTVIPAGSPLFQGVCMQVKNANVIIEDSVNIISLLVDSGKIEFQSNVKVSHLEVLSGEVIVDNDTLFADTIELNNSALLTHNPSERYLPRSLTVISHKITVDSGATITAVNKGYPIGYTVNGDTYAVDYRDGGSHGGKGVRNSSATYGNYQYPTLPGAGGSYSTNGGGAIILHSGLIELYGEINANSLDGNHGCGAGGSVLLVTDSLHGNGSISVTGGQARYVGDGGGGRVAIYCLTISNEILNNLDASGYGAGTIFINDSNTVNGNLIIDNEGKNAPDSSTSLTAIKTGVIEFMTENTIICDTCHFPVSHDSLPGLLGLYVNVNPANINDTSSQFKILWNDSNTLIVDTTRGRDLFNKTSEGYPFQGIINLDTLKVRNGAKGYSEDPVIYEEIELDNGTFSDPNNGEQTGSIQRSNSNTRLGLLFKKKVDTPPALSKKKEIKKQTRLESRQQRKIKREQRKIEKLIQRKKKEKHNSKKEANQVLDTLFDGLKPNQSKLIKPLKKIQQQEKQKPDNNVTLDKNPDNPQNIQLVESGISDIHKGYFISRFKEKDHRLNTWEKTDSTITCEKGDPIYTYDLLNRVTTMTSPVGTTEYHYDSTTGQLTKIVNPQGKEFTYHYNRSQIESIDRPNGITTEFSFDLNGNLETLDHRLGGSSLRSYNYTHDKNGMRESMTDNDGLHEYTYDSLYQIIAATHPTGSNPTEQFTYDAVGNRLTDINNSYTHNDLNQLTEDNDFYYHYDLDGNQILKIDKASGDSTKCTYNIENRLIKVEKPGITVEYIYGPLGRRLAKVVNGVRKEYRYDGENLIFEMDNQDSIITSYTHGPGIDQPLMMHRNNNNYYYLADGLGSITTITDSTGSVLQEHKYSVFGAIVEQTADSIENSFTYTAREWDPEVRLYYYRNRFYDPVIGRFINEDPISFLAGDVNLYRYVNNSPSQFIDPFGTECKTTGSFSVEPSIKNFKFEQKGETNWSPKLHIKKLGLGLWLTEYTASGDISAKVKCAEICIDECGKQYKKDIWSVDVSYHASKDIKIGKGFKISNKFITIMKILVGVVKHGPKAIEYTVEAVKVYPYIKNTLLQMELHKLDPDKLCQ